MGTLSNYELNVLHVSRHNRDFRPGSRRISTRLSVKKKRNVMLLLKLLHFLSNGFQRFNDRLSKIRQKAMTDKTGSATNMNPNRSGLKMWLQTVITKTVTNIVTVSIQSPILIFLRETGSDTYFTSLHPSILGSFLNFKYFVRALGEHKI